MSSSPLSICSFTRSAAAIKISNVTQSHRSQWKSCLPPGSPAMQVPLLFYLQAVQALLRSRIPSFVSPILREPLSNNLIPNSSSIWDSCAQCRLGDMQRLCCFRNTPFPHNGQKIAENSDFHMKYFQLRKFLSYNRTTRVRL